MDIFAQGDNDQNEFKGNNAVNFAQNDCDGNQAIGVTDTFTQAEQNEVIGIADNLP